MNVIKNYDHFLLVYNEILNGYSRSRKYNCYVKHFSQKDNAEILSAKIDYYNSLVADGVPSEESRLAFLKENDLWTDKDEDDILTAKYAISDNEKISKDLTSPSQRQMMKKIIDGKREELAVLERKKRSLIGPTAEFYSLNFLSEQTVKSSFFKDEGLRTPLLTNEEYERLSDEEFSEMYDEFYQIRQRFDERQMRILACLPVSLNNMGLCKKNLRLLIDKPVTDYTSFQMDLVNKCMRNINVLENSEGEPPELTDDLKEQDLLDWYDLNYSVWQGKLKNNSGDGIKTKTNYVKK